MSKKRLKKLYECLVVFLYRLIDTVAHIITPVSQSGGVLLIRTDAIGDFILWTDTLRAYEQRYAKQHITVLCLDNVEPIAKAFPCVSQVIAINYSRMHKDLWYRWHQIRLIKKRRYDFCFSSVYTCFYNKGADNFVRSVRADNKIAFDGNPINITAAEIEKSRKHYQKLIPASPMWTMEILRNAEFVKKTIDPHFKPGLPNLSFVNGLMSNEESYVVIVTGAGKKSRRWPLNRFCELIQRLPNNLKVILLGNESECDLGKTIMAQLMNDPVVSHIEKLIGKLSLLDSLNVIKSAKLLIGNDSAMWHAAAALRVQSLIIVGGGHHSRFFPYSTSLPENFYHPHVVQFEMPCFRCNWNCNKPLLNAAYPSIDAVTLDMVKDAFVELIKK